MQNKTYDVYAIGNALVDYELQVESSILEQLVINPGVMTLVDHERFLELKKRLESNEINRFCGGSAGNTANLLSILGSETFYSCRVADDEEGRLYVDTLSEAKVATNLDKKHLISGNTGKCMVFLTPDTQRTMVTFLGVTQDLSISDIFLHAVEKSRFLYIEGYVVTSPSAFDAVSKAKKFASENGIKTALTLSDPNIAGPYRDKLIEVIGNKIDLIFSNEEEALLFTKAVSLELAVIELKSYARRFVVTRGSKGCVVYDGDDVHDIPAVDVKVVDTVGAGDAFAGAFLHALSKEKTFIEAAHFANLVASHIVSRIGPRLDKSAVLKLKDKLS